MAYQAQRQINFELYRGGTSKGLIFLKDQLPSNQQELDALLIRLMGSDLKQIDGLGGGQQVTSKVGIVSKSERPGVDVDYLFVQVIVGKNEATTAQPCANILYAVGPYAIEHGLVSSVNDGMTPVNVYLVNNGSKSTLHVSTIDGKVDSFRGSGVKSAPSSGALVVSHPYDIEGSACGAFSRQAGNLTIYAMFR